MPGKDGALRRCQGADITHSVTFTGRDKLIRAAHARVLEVTPPLVRPAAAAALNVLVSQLRLAVRATRRREHFGLTLETEDVPTVCDEKVHAIERLACQRVCPHINAANIVRTQQSITRSN